MNQLDLVDSFAGTVASALGFGIVEAAAFAAVVFVLARMSRMSATTRHVLWWIALAAAAALPFASVAGSLGRIEHHSRLANADHAFLEDSATTARVTSLSSDRRSSFASGDRPTLTSDTRPSVGAAERSADNPSRGGIPFADAANVANALVQQLLRVPHLATALVALWLAVAATGLAMLARNLVSLARIKRAALPLDESVVRRLRRWRHSTRLGRAVDLRVSNEVDVPVAVGFRTPTILLPVRVVEMEEIADLDQIAMHEYAHLDRYDDWTNLAQRAVERIFWFNPVVLFAGRQISLEREIACDDWVVAQTGRAHRYATCLWKLVESARFPMKPIVAPGALLSAKQITRRIEQLLDSRRNALPRLSPLGALGLGVLAVALVVVQAERAPVIAIDDAAPLNVAQSRSAPPKAAAPVPLPSPAPKRERPENVQRESEESIVLHVSRFATPEAIASELARTLSERDHDIVVKATVERAIRHDSDIAARVAPAAAVARAAAAPVDASAVASDGEKLGIDVAKTVATTVATSVVNGILGGTWNDRTPEKLDRETIEHCLGCDLHGRDLRGIDLHGVSLAGDDLRGADLRGVDLGAANLVGIDLRNARLDGANLKDTSLSGCDLRGASLANADLDGLHLAGTSIRGTIVAGSHLRSIVDRCMGCDLRGLDLRGQDLHDVRLTGADMRAVDLRDADLSHAKFEGVDLRDARFEGANLDGATFVGCELSGVDLKTLKGATRLDGNLHELLDETQRLNELPHAPHPPPSP